MVYVKKFTIIIITSILISAMLLSPHTWAGASVDFTDLEARIALLIEVDTGQVLYEYNGNRRHPADALTVVMTMLLAASAIESGQASVDELIEMTESAWSDLGPSDSTRSILPGEEMTLRDLMYSGFVGGMREACNLIAEHISGSTEAFVELMNERAVELGCEGTSFINAHGRYNTLQYTTAQDLFLIYREAMSYPVFAEISGVFSHTIEGTNRSEPRRLNGSNSLLNSNGKYYFRHCTSGVASATYEGGHSFIGFAEADDLSLIVVVLGSDVIMFEDDSALMRNLSESGRLFEWGFTNFSWREVLSTSNPVARAPVKHGAGADFVNLRPESSIRQLLRNDVPLEEFDKDIIIYSVERGLDIVAPVSAGQVLGEITLTRNGEKYDTILLVANTSIELHRIEFIRMQIADALASSVARAIISVLFMVIMAYSALVIRYNYIRRKRLKKIAEAKKKLTQERQDGVQITDFNDQDTRVRGRRY